MSKALESWRYQDPAKVYERIQSMERRKKEKKTKAEIAREELEKLFKKSDEGDKPNE